MATAYITQERFGVQFEDRINRLINIDPTKTAFMSMVKKAEAKNQRVDWQTQTLDAANAGNAAVDGSTVTFAAADYTAPTSLFNYTQLPRRPFAASFSSDAINKPESGSGKLSMFNTEKIRKMKVLKRDMNASLLSNRDRVQPLPESTQAGELRGVERWITTNSVVASDKKYGNNT